MNLASSQQKILQQLKTRGPQSVKILAKQLDMTTMGVRQHLESLAQLGMVSMAREERQTRGRPVHLWKLTAGGHRQFPDTHAELSVELLKSIPSALGEGALSELIDHLSANTRRQYEPKMLAAGDLLPEKLAQLVELRNEEGYLAEIRILPNGSWLLIENHCPICAAAQHCQQLCNAELTMFRQLLENLAVVERVDFLLTGSRRCAYRVTPANNAQAIQDILV